MQIKEYTEEEQEILRSNPYVVGVTSRYVYFSAEFKKKFHRLYIAGNKPTKIVRELGHDSLHGAEATKIGGFEEFNIFDMWDGRMEYEVNLFASQITLPDDDFLELAVRGYDTQQIARALNSDVNLVALEADTLISQGYRLRPQEHRNDSLKYNR